MHIFYIIYGVISVIAFIVSHNVIYYETYITHTFSMYELSCNRLSATFLCFVWPIVVLIAAMLGLFAAIGWGLCEVVSLPAKLIAKKKGLLK